MLTLNKVKFRNFKSYGGAWTEVDLSHDQLSVIIGRNGQGKCVDKSTKIKVKFKNKAQQYRFNQCNGIAPQEFKSNTKKFFYLVFDYLNLEQSIQIGDLYKFYKEFPEEKGKVCVLGRDGYHPVDDCDITASNSTVIRVTTQCGAFIKGSPDHMLCGIGRLGGNDWIKLKDLHVGDELFTRWGRETIKSIEIEQDKQDLYDIEVRDIHEYFANNFVSHNSTLTSAITFGLFNRTVESIPKPKLVNMINNKQLEVVVDFTSDGVDYQIVRGIKPNKFQIYKQGKLITEDSSNRDYQDYLESQILKMNFRTFVQTVLIAVNSFTPFVELNASDRRNVVEDVLGLKILSTMNQLLKQQIVVNNNAIADVVNRLNEIKIKCKSELEIVESLKASHNNNIKAIEQQKKQLIDQINEHNKAIDQLTAKIDKLAPKLVNVDKVNKAINNVIKQQIKLNQLVEQYVNDNKWIDSHDHCPTCHQLIDQSYKDKIKFDNDANKKDVLDKLTDLNNKLEKFQSKQNDLNKLVVKNNDYNNQLYLHNQQISALNKQIAMIDSSIQAINNTDKINELQQSIYNNAYKGKQLIEQKLDLINTKEVYQACSTILQDNGIKASIIDHYIPLINQTVNKYLGDLDFDLNFAIDNKFNISLIIRGRDAVTYQNLSCGEKRRLDIAILFAWRHIAQLTNSCNCSNIFIDEVLDSSLDGDGIDSVMHLFRSLKDNHIFVISHRDNVQDLDFDKIITISKYNQFSVIETN